MKPSPPFEDILAGFGLNNTFSHTPLGQGHINDTYLISSEIETKSYVLQRINHFVFERPDQLMENIETIKNHVTENNLCTGEELSLLNYRKTKEGELLFTDSGGNYWRLNEFIPDTFTVEFVEDKDHAYAAAHAFGKFASNLSTLPLAQMHETIKNFHNAEMRMSKFHDVTKRNPLNRVELAQDELKMALEHEYLVHMLNNLLPKMLIRVTHNDTKINNVLFSRNTGQVVSVIDLDTVMPGYLIYDFGDMVRTFSPSAGEEEIDLTKIELRKSIFTALADGYLQATHPIISEIESEHLVFGGMLMTYVQAVRFLTDYIEGDVYYHKILRADQNLQRARNQFALLNSIIDQKEDLEAIIHQFNFQN